jgi:hypothetical protein
VKELIISQTLDSVKGLDTGLRIDSIDCTLELARI